MQMAEGHGREKYGDVLRSVDNRLRAVQAKELGRGRLRSNRSNLIEQVLRDWADGGA